MDTRAWAGRKQARGQFGEDKALEHLLTQGFRLLERNYRTAYGEVDLIVERGELLVFVEVRSRADDRVISPEATVDRRKQQRVVLAALDYTTNHCQGGHAIRFDVISLVGTQVTHIENAFDAGM
jgi:putative endonuclease